MVCVCVCSGGGPGYDPGGGASSVQLQVHHLLLRPAAAAAVLQRSREDRQTAPHLGADVHVRAAPQSGPGEAQRVLGSDSVCVSVCVQDNVQRAEGLRQREGEREDGESHTCVRAHTHTHTRLVVSLLHTSLCHFPSCRTCVNTALAVAPVV